MRVLVFLRRSAKREPVRLRSEPALSAAERGRLRAATCHCERSAAICGFSQPGLRPEPMRLAICGYQRGAIPMWRSPETRRSRRDALCEGRPPHRYARCDKRCLCPWLGNSEPGEASFPFPSSDDLSLENGPRSFKCPWRFGGGDCPGFAV
jgi:hypothetical protein